MGGKKEILLEHGGIRKFIKDGDEVTMTAVCQVFEKHNNSLKFLLVYSCRRNTNSMQQIIRLLLC